MGKTNCGNEDLVYLASAIKDGRRRRLAYPWTTEDESQTSSMIWFAFYCWLFPKEHHSSSSSLLLCSVSSKIVYFVIFSQKHGSQSAATELPAFQPTKLSSNHLTPIYPLSWSFSFYLISLYQKLLTDTYWSVFQFGFVKSSPVRKALFFKIFCVHTKTKRRCVQIPPVWSAFWLFEKLCFR